MKKYLLTTLLLCSFALTSGAVFADGVSSLPPSASSGPTSVITPMASKGYAAQSLTGQQMSYSFDVTKSMPEWRVWIQNTSNYEYKVTITKGSPTGKVEWSGTIPANDTWNVWSNREYSADTYYVNFTCGTGNMSGSVAARIASTHDEILP